MWHWYIVRGLASFLACQLGNAPLSSLVRHPKVCLCLFICLFAASDDDIYVAAVVARLMIGCNTRYLTCRVLTSLTCVYLSEVVSQKWQWWFLVIYYFYYYCYWIESVQGDYEWPDSLFMIYAIIWLTGMKLESVPRGCHHPSIRWCVLVCISVLICICHCTCYPCRCLSVLPRHADTFA